MNDVLDDGPFFHGTIVDLRVGDALTAGHPSNYRPEVVMNHVYFTALPDGAGRSSTDPAIPPETERRPAPAPAF